MGGKGASTQNLQYFPQILKKVDNFQSRIASNYQTCFNMSKLAILSVKNNFALAMKHSVPVKA